MNIHTQLGDLQKDQEELKIESQMMAVTVAKLQTDYQELKNEANELMIKNDQQQMLIEELTSKCYLICLKIAFFVSSFLHYVHDVTACHNSRVAGANVCSTKIFQQKFQIFSPYRITAYQNF